VVTDPQTHTQTHRQDRLQYTALLGIARSVIIKTVSCLRGGKYSHVTGLIRDRLHWLPVTQRIQFKLCLMMYKAMHGLVPASELCASSCVEGRTRSSARGDLVVQRMRTKFGGRAFVVAGPAAWNRAVLRSQLSVRGQFQDGSEYIFSSLLAFNSNPILMLLHALYERLCTAPLNRSP